MKQWWLVIALLLSLGINLGLVLGGWWHRPLAPEFQPGPPPEARFRPGPGAEGEPPPEEGVLPPGFFPPSDQEAPGGEPGQPALGGEPPAGLPIDRPFPAIERFADDLRLEGEPRRGFIEQQRRFFQETLTARERLFELQGMLRQELAADQPNRTHIDQLLQQTNQAHFALEKLFVDNLLKSREFLNPEQQRRYLRQVERLRNLRRPGPRPFPPGERPFFNRPDPRRRPPGANRPPEGF